MRVFAPFDRQTIAQDISGMLQRSIWQHEFLKLFHLFNLSQPQQPIVFQLSVADMLGKSAPDAQQFRAAPSEYLQRAVNGLKEHLVARVVSGDQGEQEDLATLRKLENVQVQVKYIPYTARIYKTFSQLNSDQIGKWVVLTGTVIQAMQKKTLDKSKLFVCCSCGAAYRVRIDYQNCYRFEMPALCPQMVKKPKSKNFLTQLFANFHQRRSSSPSRQRQPQQLIPQRCGSTKFQPTDNGKICIDYQQLRVQEQFQFISSGKIPQTLTVIMEGYLSAAPFRPGDDLTVTGVLSYRYRKLLKDSQITPQLIIFANSVINEKNGNYQSLTAQQLDKNSEREMSRIYANFPLNYYSNYELTSKQRIIIKQLEFRKETIDSFCPAIYGRNIVKLGLLLAVLGGVSLENEASKIRGNSHVLLVGEPGTGKSVLLKQVAKLADRSFFTNGIGTTSAGLSVSYFKEGKDWMIEAGALILADNGVCCIDQLTLLSKNDEKSLLESMEQQTISSAKASVVTKLNARTTVIGACNPIRPGQIYDNDLDLQSNTGLSIPLLTRFDMVFIMKDEKDIAEDAEKCDHILSNFYGHQSDHGRMPKPPPAQKLNLKPLLKKCKNYHPELSSHELLTIYYTHERKRQSKVKTARAFESLCRIAEAHAKLMMREKTVLLDYVTAIALTENNYFSTIEEYYAILDNFNKKYSLSLS